MKICMVTTFYPPYHFGGDAIYVYQLSNELARTGHHVDVIHCRDSFELFGQQPRPPTENHPNVRVHTLMSPWKGLSPFVTQQTARMGFKRKEIERILHEGEFDVIHYHNVSLVGGLDVLAAGEAVKLYTLHDYWLVCPTHVMFKNMQSACKEPNCFRCQLVYRRPPQLWRHTSVVEKALQHVDRVLAACEFTLNLHQERGLHLKAEVLPIFSQVSGPSDRGEVDHVPDAPADETPGYFLFVGRLEKLKGLQDVLPYFRANNDLELRIAGSGSYEAELKKQAAGCRNIRFLGQCTGAELGSLYESAIATVIPSLTYEVTAMVMLESWARRTPVVARDIGGLGEIVRQNGGGLYFSSMEELFGQLDSIRQDKALRDRLGEEGHDAYIKDWTAERHLSRYLSLIDQIRESRDA